MIHRSILTLRAFPSEFFLTVSTSFAKIDTSFASLFEGEKFSVRKK